VGVVLTSEALGAFEALVKVDITEVGSNQTGNLMVSPRRLSVAMHGGPTFPKEGKVKGSLGKWVPSLVLPRIDAIDTDSIEGPLRKTNSTHYKSKKQTIKQTFPQ
jgi:hypothetical protein